jgi:regulator of PEP synthase PpsR (kinase-PPPase family)
MKINFQTMDANDRLILQSNHEIITYIQTQTPILDAIRESIGKIPDVINYLFQETIAAFISNQSKENQNIIEKLTSSFFQGISAINWEIQNQRKEYEANNKFDDVITMEQNTTIL